MAIEKLVLERVQKIQTQSRDNAQELAALRLLASLRIAQQAGFEDFSPEEGIALLTTKPQQAERGSARFEYIPLEGTTRAVIKVGEKEKILTSTENLLLRTLMGNPNQVMTREDLARTLDPESLNQPQTVDVLIHRLRAKIGPGIIETVRRQGYSFRDPLSEPASSN